MMLSKTFVALILLSSSSLIGCFCLVQQQQQQHETKANRFFSDLVLPRITERLNGFFDVSIEIVQHFILQLQEKDRKSINDSSNNFTNHVDRKLFFKTLYALSLSANQMGYDVAEIHIAFEDGMVIGLGRESLVYREPGTAGYNISDIQPNDPNYKHYISCFNNTDGTKQNCSMHVGEPYIECVNDCELIPCPISATSSNKTNGTSVSNEIILCKNYNIKQVQEGELFGYIPILGLCSNRRGEPEYRPGHAVANRLTNELGNCYYSDRKTLVTQSQPNGDYFACGGNGTVCDTAFTGAWTQALYDPRYRPILTELRQNPNPRWKSPILYPWSYFLVIRYQQPIFSYPSIKNENGTKENVKVLQATVFTDYRLSVVTNFLRREYNNAQLKVLIVEGNAPHYVIATSYHDKLQNVKAVLLSDVTKPCPDQRLHDAINNSTGSPYYFDTKLCDVVRIPVIDLKDSTNEYDIISYRAFAAHQKKHFAEDTVVYLKDNDAIGSQAYVSKGISYRLPHEDSTTVWFVVAIFPMDRSTNDSSVQGDASFTAICTIGCLGFVACFASFAKYHYSIHRKTRFTLPLDHQQHTVLTSAFLLGCAALNLSSLILIGQTTDQTCMLRMWTFNGLLACALSPLLIKVWRMNDSVNMDGDGPVLPTSNCNLFLCTLPAIFIQLLILTVFSVADPPIQTEVLGVGDGIGMQQITCEQKTNAFLITQIVYNGVIIGFGCTLAYKTRNLTSKLTETAQVVFCWYNIAVSAIVTIVTIQLIVVDRESQIIVQATGIFWSTFFSSIIFVLPILLPVDSVQRSNMRSNINNRNRPTSKPLLSSYVSDLLTLYDNSKSNDVASNILETIVERNHDDDQQHQTDSTDSPGVSLIGKEQQLQNFVREEKVSNLLFSSTTESSIVVSGCMEPLHSN